MKQVKIQLLILALCIPSIVWGQGITAEAPFSSVKIDGNSYIPGGRVALDYPISLSGHLSLIPGIGIGFYGTGSSSPYPDHNYSEKELYAPVLIRYSMPVMSAGQLSIFGFIGPEFSYSLSRNVTFWRMNDVGVKVNSTYDYFSEYGEPFESVYVADYYDNMQVLNSLKGLPIQKKLDVRACAGIGITLAGSFDVFVKYSYGFMERNTTNDAKEYSRYISAGVRLNFGGFKKYSSRDF